MTEKESYFFKAAIAILQDVCPKYKELYLCLRNEDDSNCCFECWLNVLELIGNDKIKY